MWLISVRRIQIKQNTYSQKRTGATKGWARVYDCECTLGKLPIWIENKLCESNGLNDFKLKCMNVYTYTCTSFNPENKQTCEYERCYASQRYIVGFIICMQHRNPTHLWEQRYLYDASEPNFTKQLPLFESVWCMPHL